MKKRRTEGGGSSILSVSISMQLMQGIMERVDKEQMGRSYLVETLLRKAMSEDRDVDDELGNELESLTEEQRQTLLLFIRAMKGESFI